MYNKLLVLLGIFLFQFSSVFAGIEEITKAINSGDVSKVIEALLGFEIVVFFAMVLILTVLLKEFAFKKMASRSAGVANFLSFIVALMVSSGFIYLLAKNDIAPVYYVILVAEIAMIIVALLIIILFWQLSRIDNEVVKGNFIKVLGILLAFTMLHMFNGLFLEPVPLGGGHTEGVKSIFKDDIKTDSILFQISSWFYFTFIGLSVTGSGSILFLGIVLGCFLFYLKSPRKVPGKVAGGLSKMIENDKKYYNRLDEQVELLRRLNGVFPKIFENGELNRRNEFVNTSIQIAKKLQELAIQAKESKTGIGTSAKFKNTDKVESMLDEFIKLLQTESGGQGTDLTRSRLKVVFHQITDAWSNFPVDHKTIQGNVDLLGEVEMFDKKLRDVKIGESKVEEYVRFELFEGTIDELESNKAYEGKLEALRNELRIRYIICEKLAELYRNNKNAVPEFLHREDFVKSVEIIRSYLNHDVNKGKSISNEDSLNGLVTKYFDKNIRNKYAPDEVFNSN